MTTSSTGVIRSLRRKAVARSCHSPFRTALVVGLVLGVSCAATAQTKDTIVIRGHAQTLRLYGVRGQTPLVVSGGDGGWVHLAPHVAGVLAARGFFVVGFDVKAYLESFTSGKATLRPEEEPGDYRALTEFAGRGASTKPILIGISEGAGLSMLAATDPQTRASISGVLGLGLPEISELGWRWRDALIYLTHGVPNEPTFKASSIASRIAPTPLAAIHSTHDEFAPLSEVRRIVDAAGEPKRLWVVEASDHRFSDNLDEFDRQLVEALAWIAEHAPRH
jgi:hypothetical protein